MRNHRQSGYSLAEMLTVIAIIGTLALVTIPAFMTYMQSNKMKTSVRQFTGDLRAARARSIGQGQQVMVTFLPGAGKRAYDIYQGNRPFNSTAWTRPTSPESLKTTRYLDSTVYFPTTAGAQTFEDVVDCSSAPCAAGTDTKLDIIFFPDGRVQMPTGLTVGTVSVQTDQKIPKPLYAITISPSGKVQAN
jgi:prepilin-type N-terminal cleavage/methylation domain-containing protein